jgi:predicted heme/steroid binding protein
MVANQKGTADKPQEQTNYGNTIREKIQEEGRLYNPHDHQEWQDGSKQNHYEANQDNYLSTQRFHLYNQHNTV